MEDLTISMEPEREPNFSMEMGDRPCYVRFNFMVNKTIANKLKYWLFCKFFPFRIVKWDKK